MSNTNKNETESPDIIEEIIPGKNNDYNDKSINQNNNNNQQSSIENYDEKESAQAVIEVTEESKQSIEGNTDEAANQIRRYTQAATEPPEQTAQATRKIAENHFEFQKQTINSFQSLFTPYLQNIQNQLLNNQQFFKSMSEMYSNLVRNYTENAIALSRIWSDISFANTDFYKNVADKASK